MQDVSDKLLEQFVECLRSKVVVPPAAAASPEATDAGSATDVTDPAEAAEPAAAARPEALDLGATVVPVLLRSYGKQLGLALLLAALIVRLARRRRS